MAVKSIDKNHPDAIVAREAEQKLAQLKKRLRLKENEFEAAHNEYARAMAKTSTERIGDAAALLLAGGELTTITRSDLERLRTEREVLTAAGAEQQRIVAIAQGRVSRALHETNRSEYIAIEKRIAAAVAELARANEAEARFFEDLKAAGCNSITFRPMGIKAVGLASDKQSPAAFHAREVREHCPEAAA